MKAASPGLIAALNGGQKFLLADLYTFTLVNGTVARYAVADGDIVYGGNTFSGTTVVISRGKIKTVIGMQVDTLDLTIEALPTHLLSGAPFLQACGQRAMDGAQLKLERLFMTTFGDTSLGTIILFSGRVGEISIGRSQVQMRVNSDLELLNVDLPRNLFQPGCINTLFDGGCTLVKASFGVTSTIAGSPPSTSSRINCGLANPTNYFALGTLTFTSGVLSGVSASIQSYTPGVIGLLMPLTAVPAAGDAFTAYPGCDKQMPTCTSKFSNLINFRGTPFIPVPETLL